ncbi:MAG: hypothetical protein ACQEQF_00205 [Bacillota bacterium]
MLTLKNDNSKEITLSEYVDKNYYKRYITIFESEYDNIYKLTRIGEDEYCFAGINGYCWAHGKGLLIDQIRKAGLGNIKIFRNSIDYINYLKNRGNL